MRAALDPHDRSTVYADLRDCELLTDDVRSHATKRARELGAAHVEFWRSPFGDGGGHRMAGFIELAAVPPKSEVGSEPANALAHVDVTQASAQQLSPAV